MPRSGFLWKIAIGILTVGLSSSVAQVVVRVAPPPPRSERALRRPGGRYVWVPGYYRWNRRGYFWVPGRWVIPPRPGAAWIPPRWDYVRPRRSYVFVDGYWR